ncbi:phosphatase PAP2 family protein [bacterium]|nr:MAG: phosphatase PAP2 family protein [bacterium]
MVHTKGVILFVCWALSAGLLLGQEAKAQTVSIDASAPSTLIPAEQAHVHLSSRTTSSATNQPAWAKFASGTGSLVYLAAGTLLPLIEDGKEGKQHALRTADALITSTLITEALKTVTHEKRPDGSDYKSFPSGHSTAAFAVATMQAHYHPRQALFWYGGATIISASRVTLDRHYTHDVIAGAAVGFLTSQLALRQKHGLLLFPFIAGSATQRVAGISVGGAF